MGQQVDDLEVVRVDFEQSEGIDAFRQHQTIDRAGKHCDDEEDCCDEHQGSMAAAAQVCLLMGISGRG
jgi:hypothetical protein